MGRLTEIRMFVLRDCTDISVLRGKSLACWCKPGEPCHADVLLELANEDAPHPPAGGGRG